MHKSFLVFSSFGLFENKIEEIIFWLKKVIGISRISSILLEHLQYVIIIIFVKFVENIVESLKAKANVTFREP